MHCFVPPSQRARIHSPTIEVYQQQEKSSGEWDTLPQIIYREQLVQPRSTESRPPLTSIESAEQAHQGTRAILPGLLAWWLASVALRVCSKSSVALHVRLVTKVSEFLLSQRWPLFHLFLLKVWKSTKNAHDIFKIKLLVTYLSYTLTAVFPLSSPLIPSSHLPYNTPTPTPNTLFLCSC